MVEAGRSASEAKQAFGMNDQAQSAVRELLQRLTAAWRSGRFEELDEILHEDVVFVAPGFAGRIGGRKECVATYRQFSEAAQIMEYVEEPPAIEAWANTAVATCGFEMSWEMDGESHRETGHDILVLELLDGRWQIVWRTLVSKKP
jgi:ketosteroid isomerase-like protein